ncbi:MAG: GyrI-like domain-containing protein [Clostridia bacterium]|nr:GyrI-like domain-containing protein [Clostridia bacterium]
MLKPYIVEKGIMRIMGKSVSFGGSRPKTSEIGDLFGDRRNILGSIPNRVDERFLGISINFWNNDGEKKRHSYMLGAEVSSLAEYPLDHECRMIPASRWVYVPVRYDDPEVKALSPTDKQDDMGFLTGCVFGWAKKWIVESGYIKQDFPEELEIYGLYEGYAFPEGDGANITLGIPII